MGMDAALLPYLAVRMSGVAFHAWEPGDALLGLAADSPRLWIVTAGRVNVRLSPPNKPASIPSFTAEVRAGEAVLLPGDACRDIRTPEGAAWLSVGLTATLFGAIDLTAALHPPRAFIPEPETAPTATLLRSLLERLATEQGTVQPWRPGGVREMIGSLAPLDLPRDNTGDGAALLLRDAFGRAVFGLLWRELSTPGAALPTAPLLAGLPEWLVGVLARIAREPAVSLADLARAGGVSDVQMRRAFRRHLGVSPHAYLLRARLDAACRLLATTDQSVVLVAGHVGFESLSYFTRLFKRTFGHTPAQHRQPGA